MTSRLDLHDSFPQPSGNIPHNVRNEGQAPEVTPQGQLASKYNVNKRGFITDPGKFEGEPAYAPYYWQQGLDGSWDEDENGVYFFLLGDADYAAFPVLKGEYGLAIEESEQCFVRVTTFSTQAAYARSLARMVEDEANTPTD